MKMHLSVISNPTSPPEQFSSELEPMSTSEDEDLANNNEYSTADTAAEHSSISASSSTTDSDLSSNLNFAGFFENGNLNELSSADTEEAEELIRKAAQTLLDQTPLRARQLAQSRSFHSIRPYGPVQPAAPFQPPPSVDYHLQRRHEREGIRRRLAMLDIGDDGDLIAPRTPESSPKESKVERIQTHPFDGRMMVTTKTVTSAAATTTTATTTTTVVTPRKSRVQRPTSFPCRRKPIRLGCMTPICTDDQSFTARKARLMAEARLALAQAPEVARREIGRLRELRTPPRRPPAITMATSPPSSSLSSSGSTRGLSTSAAINASSSWPASSSSAAATSLLVLPPAGARRFTRPLLSKMGVARLELILNHLHGQVERLNDELVHLLLQRDELNIERDGKLLDIEDLDRIEPDCNTSLLSTLVRTM